MVRAEASSRSDFGEAVPLTTPAGVDPLLVVDPCDGEPDAATGRPAQLEVYDGGRVVLLAADLSLDETERRGQNAMTAIASP